MLRDPASRPASPFHHGLGHQPLFPHHIAHRPSFSSTFSCPGPSQSQHQLQQQQPSSSQPIPFLPSSSPSSPALTTPSTPCAAIPIASSSRPSFSQSHSQPQPQSQSQSQSQKMFSRPKPLKKPSASTSAKQRNVQLSLEVKVEKAKGFHAFFVPLCKNMPPAPPCSPVLSSGGQMKQSNATYPSHPSHGLAGQGREDGLNMFGSGAVGDIPEIDYFGQWTTGNVDKGRDQWVEHIDVSRTDSMEVDMS